MIETKRKNVELVENSFTTPVLHISKSWYVDFFVVSPDGRRRRKRYYISNDLPLRMKRQRASELLSILTHKLQSGWSPFVDDPSCGKCMYTELSTCLSNYLVSISKHSRAKTIENYRSRVRILNEYNKGRATPIKQIWEFDRTFCACFLEWLRTDRNVCPRTVNNYRGWLHGFCEFLICHKFISHNPVDKISPLRENERIRRDMTPEMLKTLSVYLQDKDLHFYLACMMEYYTMIRPSELVNLKIGDICIDEQSVYVDGSFSKNHKSSYVGLNDSVMRLLIQLDYFSFPNDYYIFSRGLVPGKRKAGADIFNKRWREIRDELRWLRCYQFYSLKDSGIRDLANAEGVVVARDQARHSDVAVTNKYIQQHTIHDSTRHFKGNL